jgi:hypothetical protein
MRRAIKNLALSLMLPALAVAQSTNSGGNTYVPGYSTPIPGNSVLCNTGSSQAAPAGCSGAQAQAVINSPNIVDPTNSTYGADRTGAADSTTAIATAASTQIGNVYPTVHLPSGTYKISNAIALQGGQCLYGDGDHSTFLHIGSNFSTSASGVVTLSGAETSSPCIHDIAFLFDVPPGFGTTTAAAQASGTTIAVAASIPVNYYVDDTTTTTAIPALTHVTAVSGTGPYTLTLSGTVTGVLNGDTILANPARASFVALGSCTTGSGGTGCQYPPAVYDIAANRPRIWNTYVSGAWAGFDFTGGGTPNIVPWMENISMGALSYGMRMDGGQDFSHVRGWHAWVFGLGGNDGNRAYSDGTTIGWQIGRIDGLNAEDLNFFEASLVITANASNSETPSTYTNVMLDTAGANLTIQGGTNNQFANLYKTGSSSTATLPVTVSAGRTSINECYLSLGGSVNYVSVTGGSLSLGNCYLPATNNSGTAIAVSAGTLDMENNVFAFPSTATSAAISQTGGNLIAKNNWSNSGTGTILSVSSDNVNNYLVGNNFPGYISSVPVGNVSGYYSTTYQTYLQGSSTNLPQVQFWDSSGVSNQKGWVLLTGGSTFNACTVPDSGTITTGDVTGCFLTVQRSGSTITSIQFQNLVDNPSIQFNTSGKVTFGGPLFLGAYTITGLPTCSSSVNQGTFASVSNGVATPTYLATPSTTGSAYQPVYCNGTGWVYH